MTTIVTVLTEGFADWETALLSAVARSYYKVETRFATPGGRTVTSSGNMRVTPDLTLETLDLAGVDALVICGGTIWQSPAAPDMTTLLRQARENGVLIGAICDGTVAAARAGLLDDVPHTSNGAGYLDFTGYAGKPNYQDVPSAVLAGRLVTAPGTAPVSFMHEVMAALGHGDGDLGYYVGLHAAQFARAA